MAGPVLELKNLSKEIPKQFGDPFVVFKNINLAVRDGEFVSIVGPSGCGKTTLLRVINGLLPPSSGQIFIDSREQRGLDNELLMGFVFQGASLLPWRTSLKNVLLGLEGRKNNPKEAKEIAQNARAFAKSHLMPEHILLYSYKRCLNMLHSRNFNQGYIFLEILLDSPFTNTQQPT